jgi:glutamine synthetase adenylyltransferase
MSTLVDKIANECESIISLVENVVEIATNDETTTNLLKQEDFENISTIAEELQSLVLGSDSDEYVVTTDEDFDALSITLYQEIKYIVEALEESITNIAILDQFELMRDSVDYIRGFALGLEG